VGSASQPRRADRDPDRSHGVAALHGHRRLHPRSSRAALHDRAHAPRAGPDDRALEDQHRGRARGRRLLRARRVFAGEREAGRGRVERGPGRAACGHRGARPERARGGAMSLRWSIVVMLVAFGCGGARPAASGADDEVMFEDERAAREAPQASEEVARGEALLAQGDAAGAEAIFRSAIEADPRDARAHLDLGLALEMQERLDEAESAYRAAIAIDPGLAEAQNNLGVLLRDQGRTDEAIAALREAVRARPGFASAHLNLGLALEDAGEVEEAIAAYRRVTELAPREPTSRIQLGLLLLAQGQRDEALIALRRAVEPAEGDRAML